jgi:hypothetical protein
VGDVVFGEKILCSPLHSEPISVYLWCGWGKEWKMARDTDHGTVGRLHLYSDMNTDREPASKQVWAELMKDGRVIGTASGNCASETGEIEADNGKAYKLTRNEFAHLERVMDAHEGQ